MSAVLLGTTGCVGTGVGEVATGFGVVAETAGCGVRGLPPKGCKGDGLLAFD